MPTETIIQCAECIDNCLICLQCYINGNEFKDHRRFHDYKVINGIHKNKAKFQDNFNLNDEWLLLQSYKKFGIGNWENCLHNINNNKHTPQDIEHHFFNQIKGYDKYQKKIHNNNDNNEDMDMDNNRKISRSSIKSQRSNKNRRRSKERKGDYSAFPKGLQDKFCYNDKRFEFEAEYEDDYEAKICGIEFYEWDTKNERSFKLNALQLYNGILDERIKRKKFILKHGIHYDKFLGGNESEIFNNMAKFALYSKEKKKFIELHNGLQKEHKLRTELNELRQFMLNGVKDKKTMESYKKYQKKKNNDSFITESESLYTGESSLLDIKSFDMTGFYSSIGINKENKKRKTFNSINKNYKNNNNNDSNNNIDKRKKRSKRSKSGSSVSSMNIDKNVYSMVGITKKNYKIIMDEAKQCIYTHGLLNDGETKHVLHVDINDVKDISQTSFKIGNVQPIPYDLSIKNKNK